MDFEQDACRDSPSNQDILYSDLMGADEPIKYPERVLRWSANTVYNQGLDKFTKMACGAYGIIHWTNIHNLMDGSTATEIDPKTHWKLFVDAHKTDSYDPVTQGSSLQAQVDFAKKSKHIEGYVKLNKRNKDEYIQNLVNQRCIYTWSSNIDRRKTRDSSDKFAVIWPWAGHIVLIRWYWPKGLVIRNSYWPNYMDDWDFYLRWEDLWALFSCYALIDAKDSLLESLKKKIIARQRALSETKVYEVRVNENGKKQLKWRPK